MSENHHKNSDIHHKNFLWWLHHHQRFIPHSPWQKPFYDKNSSSSQKYLWRLAKLSKKRKTHDNSPSIEISHAIIKSHVVMKTKNKIIFLELFLTMPSSPKVQSHHENLLHPRTQDFFCDETIVSKIRVSYEANDCLMSYIPQQSLSVASKNQ